MVLSSLVINMPREIHLWDFLKLGKPIYVSLNHKYQADLFESAKKVAGGWKNLAKYLTKFLERKIFVQHFKRWRTGKQKCKHGVVNSFTPLDVIGALSDLLSEKNLRFDHVEIERRLLSIGNKKGTRRIWYPRLPVSLQNPSVGAVIGHILHDGCLGKEFRPVYYGFEVENITNFKKNVRKMFGSRVEFYEKHIAGVTRIACPTIVGYFLALIGVHPGNKVKNNVSPPSWLFSCKKEVIRAYLQASVSDEASVKVSGNGGGCIRMKLASGSTAQPSKLIQADWELLKIIGVSPTSIYPVSSRITKKGEVRASWEFRIHGRENFKIFKEEIGFLPKHKQARLMKILASYRYPSDYVSLREGFRSEFFESAFKLKEGISNYRHWLESKLQRKIHLASIYDWYAGRYSVPLEVIGATAALLNSKKVKYSLADIRANILRYKPSHNHQWRTISQQTLSNILEN